MINYFCTRRDPTRYSIFSASVEDKSKIVLKIYSIVLQQIDSDLTWQQHVDYIYSKIIKFSGIFYKIRNNFPSGSLPDVIVL